MTIKQKCKICAAALREAYKAFVAKEQKKPAVETRAKGLRDADSERYLTMTKRDGSPLMEKI